MIMYAKRGEEMLPFQVDDEDGARLSGRRFYVGSHGYVQSRSGLLHRELLSLRTRDGKIADHINGDRRDNRRANLRLVTPSMSSANVRHEHTYSGMRGVYPNKSRWAAAGKKDGRKIHLGTYDTREQAAEVAHLWRLENLPGYVRR